MFRCTAGRACGLGGDGKIAGKRAGSRRIGGRGCGRNGTRLRRRQGADGRIGGAGERSGGKRGRLARSGIGSRSGSGGAIAVSELATGAAVVIGHTAVSPLGAAITGLTTVAGRATTLARDKVGRQIRRRVRATSDRGDVELDAVASMVESVVSAGVRRCGRQGGEEGKGNDCVHLDDDSERAGRAAWLPRIRLGIGR